MHKSGKKEERTRKKEKRERKRGKRSSLSEAKIWA
jgi:hypothetical protein